jgi:2-oxoisovalerate dehydrogenase E1 component
MSGGTIQMPVVIRTNIGSGYGVQHSQDYSIVISAITGINLVIPATPYDAKGLLNYALSLGDPTIFVETQKLYDKPEMFVKEGVPKDYYEIPFGEGVYRSKGEDITICTLGASLYKALEAKEDLENIYGLTVDLIDMRSAVPFNYEILIESIKKTGRIVFVNEGFERSNFMKNVSQTLMELAFEHFDAPPIVLGARN